MSAVRPQLSALPLTRVLVAQADQVSLAHLRGLLDKSGYQVLTVVDGKQTLSMLQSPDAPSLAVIDWMMPGLTGLEICREIRQGNQRRSTYVILLMPWSEHKNRAEGLEAGADDCIFKPVDTRELRVRLQIGAKIILERALHESEERFHNSFEHAGIGMAVMNLTGRFQQVNRALCDLLGYRADDLRRMSLHEICHTEEIPPCSEILQRFCEGEEGLSGEFERRFVTCSGAVVWTILTLSLVLDSDDHPASFVFQAQDITGRRRTQEALQESLAASKRALKELADQKDAMDQHAIISISDVRGRITYVNDQLCSISKYSREELLGRDHRLLNSGYHSRDFFTDMYKTIGKGRVWQGEIRNRAKDGTFFWSDTTIVPFLAEDGNPRQYVAIRSDITKQKEVEEALRSREAFLRAITENISDLVIMRDLTYKCRYASPSYERDLGYAPKELEGIDSGAIIHPEDLPSVRQKAAELLQDGKPRMVQGRYLHKDGSFRHVEANFSLLRNAAGVPEGYVVVSRLIDDRLAAEAALRRSESLFLALSNNIEDLMLMCDMELKFRHLSKSTYSILGYSAEELVGAHASAILHPNDMPFIKRSAEEIVSSGQAHTVVVRYRHRNGSWLHVEANGALLRDADGAPDGFVVVARVIEQRLEAERKLQAAHTETELFLQSIPSILIGVNSGGCITRWNLTAASTFGLEPHQVIGRRIRDCAIRWLRPDIDAEIDRWWTTSVSCRVDDLSYEKDGTTRFLGLQVRRIPGNHGEEPGFIVTGADITERKGLEEQLRQAQKLEAIGQLAAGIAHEINTPTQYTGDNIRFLKDSWDEIADFLTFCGEVREQAEEVPLDLMRRFQVSFDKCDFPYLLKEIPHAIGQSLEGLQRVAKIVRGMKEFSHPGSKEKRAVDINKAIETTITVSRNEWKYSADLVTAFDNTLPLVPCHVGEFNQVILNLIVNASHAISTVAQENGHLGTITITTRRNENWALIDVADTGGGIPEEIRSRIFEPFFTTKEVGKGTGQGLALAHSVIVNQHQGQIWFDSEVGKGSTFHIRLPLETGTAVS